MKVKDLQNTPGLPMKASLGSSDNLVDGVDGLSGQSTTSVAQIPMDTASSINSNESPGDAVNSDGANIENALSPAYSDISDANDTEGDITSSIVSIKSSSEDKPEEPGNVNSVATVGNSASTGSNSFGIFPFFNQTPFILPVGTSPGEPSTGSKLFP